MRTAGKMVFGLIAFFIFLVFCTNFNNAQNPPFEDTSYEARGEIVLQYANERPIAMMFEENFDFESKRSVYTAWCIGLTTTLYEDMSLNQTLKYEEGYVDGKLVKTCRIYTPDEWIDVHNPPDLELFELNQTTVFFPLMQLLWGLSERFLKPGTNVKTEYYRDIPSNKWTYQLNYTSKDKTVDYAIDVEAYWSNGEWNTSAKESIVPLGFVIHHNGVNKSSGKPIKMDQYVNVMYFTKDYFNKEAFLPKQGIYCPGRKSLKPFPQFEGFTGLSAGIEFDWKDYDLDSNIDMKIDSSSNLVQIEYDPTNQDIDPMNPKKKRSSVLIASYDQRVAYDKLEGSCKLIPINEANYDIQTIYDIEFLSKLTANHFFGQGVKYIYIGETIKRGIPCHMWQGQRRGWPKDEPSITTVWEWCIAERVGNPVMFEDGALPIISLDITVTESQLTIDAGTYVLGMQFSYNFYEVITRTPAYLKASEFDISPCFANEYKEWLQFKVNVTLQQKEAIKNATVYPDFVDLWRTAIYSVTGIQPFSLRVAKVRTILADTVLLVQFVLLDRHPDMPTYVERQVDLKHAKDNLKSSVDTGGLSIYWQNIVLKAVKGSLGTPFEIIKPPTRSTATPLTEEITTKSTGKITTHSIKTPSQSSNTNEGTTVTDELVTNTKSTDNVDTVTDAPKEEKRTMEKRHTSGAMAGLGIGMLLLGFSLGAGGTFAKFRYFPSLW